MNVDLTQDFNVYLPSLFPSPVPHCSKHTPSQVQSHHACFWGVASLHRSSSYVTDPEQACAVFGFRRDRKQLTCRTAIATLRLCFLQTYQHEGRKGIHFKLS